MPIFIDQQGELRGVGDSVADLQEARSKGWVPRDPQVQIVTRQGKAIPIASEDLDAWLSTGDVAGTQGAEAQAELTRERQLRNRSENFLGGLDAFGRAGLRTILPGVDRLLGDEEYAQFLREEHSTLDTLGSATGILASIGAGGGFGSVRGGVSALGGVGGLSTRLAIGSGKGLSAKLGGQAFGKIAGFAAEGAIENTLVEAGAVFNDATLLGDDFDVDAVGSRLFTSGLIGAGVGGIFGGGAVAGKRLLRKTDVTEEVLNSKVISDELRQVAARADANVRGPNLDRMVERRADQILADAVEMRAKKVRTLDDTVPDLKSYDPRDLGRVPEVDTTPQLDSTGAQGPAKVRKRQQAIRDKKQAAIRAKDEARIAQRVEDADSFERAAAGLDSGKRFEPISALDEVQPLSPADAIKQAKSEIKAMTNELSRLNGKLQNLDIGKLYRTNSASAMSKAIEDMDQFHNLLGKFDDLNGTTVLDDLVNSEAFTPLRNLGDTDFDNVLMDLQPGKTELGTLLQKGLKAGHSFKKAEAATQVARAEARKESVSKGIMQGLLGSMAFDFGAGMAIGLGGMAFRWARHSWAARRAAGKGLSETTKKFMKIAGKGGVRRSFNASARLAVSKTQFNPKKDSAKDPAIARMNEIKATLNDPNAKAEIEAQLAPVMAHNPGFGMRLADAAYNRLNYYVQNMPTQPLPGSPLYGDTKWEPSAAAIDAFNKVIYAGEYPQQAIEDMLVSGRVDPLVVQTVKDLYPTLWEAQRDSIIEYLVENPQPLSYDKRYTLSRMYDIPLEPTADPGFGGRLQARYAEQAIQQQQPTTSSPELAEPTKAQRLANR